MLKRFVLIIVLMTLVLLQSAFVWAVQAQTAELPPLTEPGPYGVSAQVMTFTDESRGDWQLQTLIWYPVDKTQGTPFMGSKVLRKGSPPDRSGAPYPLIVYSHGWTADGGDQSELSGAMEYLASYGYVVAAPQHRDTSPVRFELVDRPLDILAVLDGLATITEGDLAGMIDIDNIGLMGCDAGAGAVLQMLGLLRDPVHYASWCADHPDNATLDCNPPGMAATFVGRLPLDAITAYRAQLGLENTPDGQWAPFGDERIRAALVMTAWYFPLTTEDMLASVMTPTMILQGNADPYIDYEGNAVRTYTHLGTEDRYLITVINGDHHTFGKYEKVPQHFATAFFGYYLQGDETYQPYLTPEHLPDWPYLKLVWGPYEAE